MAELRPSRMAQVDPKAVIRVHCRERPLWDRKADIAHGMIVVRCSNRLDCPLFSLLAVVS